MPQVEYTDSNNNKHTLDLTSPTAKQIRDFYEQYIEQHEPGPEE